MLFSHRFSGGRPVSGRSPSKSHHKPTDKDRTPHKSGGGGGGDSGQDAKSGEKEEGAPNGRGDGDLEEEFVRIVFLYFRKYFLDL